MSGNLMHCFRPENHQHGDRTASVGLNRKTNKGKCFVCDNLPFSNVDLVEMVLGCTIREAIEWIAARFKVPAIPKGKHLQSREQREPFSRVGLGGRLENIVRSGLWAYLHPSERAILGVLCELSESNTDSLQISYRGLMRFAGVRSYATVARVVKQFERICLLKVDRSVGGDGLRNCNRYVLTLNHPVLHDLMASLYQQQHREIEAEREIRKDQRRRRAACYYR
jgi:hypothetical protein